MFADDLVLISETAEGLQDCLNAMQSYCEKWCLSINTDKTKVIIFNKGGHKFSKFSFILYNAHVEIVQQYCYLGIVFTSSGKFKTACDVLYGKALKAFYKFKQLRPQNNVKLALHLFDTLVAPIITYAGVVWAPLSVHKITEDNFINICDKSPIERLNVKLCKFLLGVQKSSTNSAVKGELGRYPLLINILDHAVCYSNRIYSLNDKSLVKLSCLDTNVNNVYECWTSAIHKIQRTFSGAILKSSMQMNYRDKWASFIQNNEGK